MGECMEVQQNQNTEVLRRCEPLSGWGMHTTMGNRRTDGPLASTMLSKLVAPWLSDGAWILDRREWRE